MRRERVKSAIPALDCLAYFDRVRHPLLLSEFCEHFYYASSKTKELRKPLVRRSRRRSITVFNTDVPNLGRYGASRQERRFNA
jgi:hypothetical protein